MEIIFSRCLYETVVLKQREQLVKYYYLAVQITGVFIDPLLSPTSPLAELRFLPLAFPYSLLLNLSEDEKLTILVTVYMGIYFLNFLTV